MTAHSAMLVVEVEWTESERGWGQRPDGFTYYPTLESAKADIAKHWLAMPAETPDIYIRPSDPEFVRVDPTFALLVQGKGRIYSDKSCTVT
jgi:hypothetical protein